MYAVASLVPVLALGGVLLQGYEREAVARGLAQGRAQAAVIEEMAIAPAAPRSDLREGLAESELSRLRSATQLSIFSGNVLRLRLRTFDGLVVFSDDGRVDGALPARHPAFRAAARGETDVAVVDNPEADNAEVGDRDASDQVIRVLQPVVPATMGQATGVLELYLPYDRIAADLAAQRERTLIRLSLGLGALYLVLALISWSSTRGLRRHAAQREHEAMHDALTGLPNRAWFQRAAQNAIDRARQGEEGALVLVDLDRFKEVNDTLGHHAGDELLRVVAERLRSSLRGDDTVARLGGDEFAIILPRFSDRQSLVALLERVRRTLAEELQLDDAVLSVEASFGVAFYPGDASDVESLLQRADAAMYRGKRGAAGVVLYDPAAAPHATHDLSLHRELRQALDRDELVLHYQPKLDLASREICGVEALIRWQHPTRGLLPPGLFLPAVEQSGLIAPLTEWVLRRALSEQTEWLAAGKNWTVSVNISARNLEAATFPARVADLLGELSVAPERLVLEVTESALAVDADQAARTVAELAAQGIAISVDDFGIGYTSLAQLRTLAVDEVKIDRTFVSGLDASEQDRAIVGSVIQLAHGLGCLVVAEGVETSPIASWLTSVGCDRAQGFYFAEPVPWRELAERQITARSSA